MRIKLAHASHAIFLTAFISIGAAPTAKAENSFSTERRREIAESLSRMRPDNFKLSMVDGERRHFDEDHGPGGHGGHNGHDHDHDHGRPPISGGCKHRY